MDYTIIRKIGIANIFTVLIFVAAVLLQFIAGLWWPIGSVDYAMREAHTAITIQDYLNNHFNLFNPRTPLFGPPWQILIEFPIYQSSVYLFMHLVSLSAVDLEFACRFVSLIYFFLSAVALALVSNRLFGRSVMRCILVFYLFCPFNLYWAKAILPDYCAIFFGLLYIFVFLKWLDGPKWYTFCLCVFFGVLGYLSKSISMIAIVIFMAVIVISFLWNIAKSHTVNTKSLPKQYFSNIFIYIKKHPAFTTGSALLFVIPGLIGIEWTLYADSINVAQVFSESVATRSLSRWYLSGLESTSVFDFANWNIIFERIHDYFTPFMAIVFLPIAFYASVKKNKSGGGGGSDTKVLAACFLAIIVTIAIAIGVYSIHSYYLIALSPFIVCIAAYGAYYLFSDILCRQAVLKIILVFLLAISFIQPSEYVKWLWSPASVEEAAVEYSGGREIASYIDSITTPDEPIIVADDTWQATIPLFANRRAFLLWNFDKNDKYAQPLKEMLHNNNFGAIITGTDFDHKQILASFDNMIQMEVLNTHYQASDRWYVYRLFSDREGLDSQLDNKTPEVLQSNQIAYSKGLSNEDDGAIIVDSSEGSYFAFNLEENISKRYIQFRASSVLNDVLVSIVCRNSDGTVENIVPVPIYPEKDSYIVKLPSIEGGLDFLAFQFSGGKYQVDNIVLY